MSWIYLLVAGLFEIGWPLGFKLSQTASTGSLKIAWLVAASVSMALSGLFLWYAQRDIPIGTAYAVWTGVGAVGTFFIGISFFGEPAGLMRCLSAFLIIAGIVGLKVFN